MHREYHDGLHLVPAHMRGGIQRWIEHGHAAHPGSFLTALLCNDLKEAVGRADEENEAALGSWVRFLYNYAPTGCWGSPERFASWRGLTVELEAEAA